MHPVSRTFSSCKAETVYPLNNNSWYPPASGKTTILLCINLIILGISFKWNHAAVIFLLLFLLSILWHVSSFPSFQRLNNIPLYWYIINVIYIWTNVTKYKIFILKTCSEKLKPISVNGDIPCYVLEDSVLLKWQLSPNSSIYLTQLTPQQNFFVESDRLVPKWGNIEALE